METTYNTITRLATMFNEDINDKIFCSALDAGIDPGTAWKATFEAAHTEGDLATDVPATTDIDLFDDVEFLLD
jgi:hypothetical protein